MTLELALSCGRYATTLPLIDGTVSPEGLEVTPVATRASPPERFTRMMRHREFDVCEMSLGSYLSSFDDPDYPFTAIPVFPDRLFRHAYMLTHADADVEHPGDFAGGSVGLISWTATAGIWMRGIAAEHYGLDVEDVTWYVDSSMDGDASPPAGVTVETAPDDDEFTFSTHGMLLRGELDGLMSPEVPDIGHDAVEQVFDDPVAVETDYYRETGVFPAMHTVVVRDDVLAEHPWVGPTLYQAFCAARDEGLARFADPDRSPLVWSFQYQLEEADRFDSTPWEHGLTPGNRRTIETLVRYAHELELVPEPYDVESLFARTTVDQGYLGH